MRTILLHVIITDYRNWQQGNFSEKGKLYAIERLNKWRRIQGDTLLQDPLLQRIIIDYIYWQQGNLSEKGKLDTIERLKKWIEEH